MEVNVWSVTEGQKDVWSVHLHCSEVEAAKGSMQKVSPGSTGHLGTNSGQQQLLLLRRISASVASWLRDGSSCDTSGRSGCCFCCWRRSEGLKVFCPPPRCHSCLRSSVNFCTMQMERNHLKMKRRHDSFLLHDLQEPPPTLRHRGHPALGVDYWFRLGSLVSALVSTDRCPDST